MAARSALEEADPQPGHDGILEQLGESFLRPAESLLRGKAEIEGPVLFTPEPQERAVQIAQTRQLCIRAPP